MSESVSLSKEIMIARGRFEVALAARRALMLASLEDSESVSPNEEDAAIAAVDEARSCDYRLLSSAGRGGRTPRR